MAYIEFKNVNKFYGEKESLVKALNDTSFSIEKGELVVILGPSGAGKTTALNILGGMDKPTSGEVLIDGKDITKYSNKELIKYRRNDIGFVFQFYNLVQNLTAKENVELATEICKKHLCFPLCNILVYIYILKLKYSILNVCCQIFCRNN